jgi:hypothetical protein
LIKSPAAFPFPGSYALQEVAGDPQLVRIIEVNHGTALVAYPARFGASGNAQVPLARLLDATPLSEAERAELDALDTKLAGAARPRKADVAREEALRLRMIRSETMKRLIEQGIRSRLIPADAGRLALAVAAAA